MSVRTGSTVINDFLLALPSLPPSVPLPSDVLVQDQDRVSQMETRLVVAEQSNRALLDEVLRLQGQLQSAVRASQDALAAERKSRDQLESVLIR